MASEQGTVAAPIPSEPPTTVENDPSRPKSLKRARPEQSQNPANSTTITNARLVDSPSPKSPRFKGTFSPSFSPAPLTGAAALADERRRREEAQRIPPAAMSENPGHRAIASLMATGGAGMSSAQDAPVATMTMSEGMSKAANAISIPSPLPSEDKSGTSPASVTSLASLGSTAQTATANSTAIASPAAMTSAIEAESRGRDERAPHFQIQPQINQSALQAQFDQPGNRASSFPGQLLAQGDGSGPPARGMSLPMPSQQLAPRSPSHKKHKCPYCETEFTRHHNLKSHLLTHSQEKPYVCQTCNMRFRRLHDLKRHMKLHTGERPHICPKCNRKFARGDALARHSKGQGGCAGRRASMGGFDGEDDFEGSNAGDGDDTGMDGVMYTNGTPHAGENEMSEEDRRRFSLPSIKAQHASGSGSGDNYAPHSRTPSTYPPAGPRPGQSSGSLYPPNADRDSSSSGTAPSMQNSVTRGHTPSTSISSMPLSTGGSTMFSQSGMTESPKPLSPAGMVSHQLGHDSSINRQRSPSLTTQFQQQHFGRRQSGQPSSPGMALPSPHAASHGPKLPGLQSLAPPDGRFTLSSQTPGLQNSTNGPQAAQQGSLVPGPPSPNTMFPPHQGGLATARGVPGAPHHQGSGDGNNLFAPGNQIWTYAQGLEEKVKQLSDKIQVMESKEKSQEDKINRLSEEVLSLQQRLNSQNQPQHPPFRGQS